jgi:hypothetical protein
LRHESGLDGSAAPTIAVPKGPAAYAWMTSALGRFSDARLRGQQRGLLLRSLGRVYR